MNKAKLSLSVVALSLAVTNLELNAATFDLSGNARVGTNLFSNLDVTKGQPDGVGSTTSFWEHRFLLRPNILIDDRFSVKTEWILLNAGPNDVNNLPPAFGSALDGGRSLNNDTQIFFVRRAWLEWASDVGILRVGRMPKSWGIGLQEHPGDGVFDDYGSTADRISFSALVGSLNLDLSYEKENEGNLNSDAVDADAYSLSIRYSNPEDLFNVGLKYYRKVLTAGSPLGSRSANNLSLFAQKRWNNFQVGGEFASINENNQDNVFGALAQIDYMPGNWTFGVDLGYASATGNSQFRFHPNYRPFLILFNQSLGQARTDGGVRGGADGHSRVGSDLGTGTGAGGAMLGKLHAAYSFSNGKYVLGSELGYAQFVKQGTTAAKKLGFEVDVHLTQNWYDNFKVMYAGGILLPGKGLDPDPQAAWGVQIRGALEF